MGNPSSSETPPPLPKSPALVKEESKEPERVWPVTWAAIICGSGVALLLLCALVFRTPLRHAEKAQPPTVAAEQAESRNAAPATDGTPNDVLLSARDDEVSVKASENSQSSVTESGTILDPAALYAKSRIAFATITTKDNEGFDTGQGSGFFIAVSQVDQFAPTPFHTGDRSGKAKAPRRGYLLTNYHVIRAAASAEIHVEDFGVKLRGSVSQVIMEREDLDLALLSVQFWPPSKPGEFEGMDSWDWAAAESSIPWWLSGGAPTLEITEGENPAIGAKVYAIGSPQGLEATLSEGIVSGYRVGAERLQFTAPVSPGSSGGPLLDSTGQVVGVVTALHRGGQNLNFAVPASEVRDFLKGQCNSRELWRGASIKDEARSVAMDLWNEHYGAKDNHKENLLNIWRAIETTGAVDQVSQEPKGVFFRNLLESLSAIDPSSCGDNEYLLHFARGRVSILIANLDIIDNPSPLGDITRQLQRSREYQSGMRFLSHSIRLNPNFAPAHDSLYNAQAMTEQRAEALLTADKLVQLVPRCPETYCARGSAFKALGELNSALQDYQTAAELSPANLTCHYRLAEIYSKLGLHNKAVESCETVIRLGGESTVVRWWLAAALQNEERFTEAIVHYQEAREQFLVQGISDFVDKCDEAISQCRAKKRP